MKSSFALFVLLALVLSAAAGDTDSGPQALVVGEGTPGVGGVVELASAGVPVPGSFFSIDVTQGAPSAQALMLAGPDSVDVPIAKFGGSLYASGEPLLVLPLALNGAGAISLAGPVDSNLCGVEIALQVGVLDAGATGGVALSNGLDVSFALPRGPLYPKEVSPVFFIASAAEWGDLDGDGSPDLVVATADFTSTDGVKIYRGRGDGTLEPPVSIETGGRSLDLALADVDEDGVLDIAVASIDSTDVQLLRGVGDGSFEVPVAFPLGAAPRAIALGDMNGDGDLDLVTVSEAADDVRVALGAGNLTFAAPSVASVGAAPVDLVLDDLDKDGVLDVAVAHASTVGVSALLGTGNGQLAASVAFSAGPEAETISAGLLDGDAKIDLLVSGEGTTWFLAGLGDGSFAGAVAVSAGVGARGADVVDVDGDGRLDVTVASGLDDVFVRYGTGGGPFGAASIVNVALNPERVAWADANGDGVVDVASIARNTVTVVLGEGNRTFPVNAEVLAGSRPVTVEIVDVTGDGLLDLLVANNVSSSQGGISVLPGLGDGTFGPIDTTPSGNQQPRFATAADMDGDGDPDLVTANGVGAVRIYLNDGTGHFGMSTGFFATDGSAAALAVDDFDGDGLRDVVVASGSVEFFPGLGDGTLGMPQSLTFAGLGFTTDVDARDFNGDGALDLAAVGLGTDSVGVALGVGDGTFAPGVLHAVGDAPRWLDTGDLDGDGAFDVVVGNTGIGAGGDSVSVLMGVGDGTFAPASFVGVRVGDSVAVADVDLDGALDIVTTEEFYATVSVLFGLGDGTFGSQRNYATARDPVYVAAADLDGDGLPELVTANFDVNRVTVLVNHLLE